MGDSVHIDQASATVWIPVAERKFGTLRQAPIVIS
jgi:hypothetical protein